MHESRLGNYKVYFENKEEFRDLKREVWGSHCYYIDLEENVSKIIDIGAHIGLATLYFAKQFPVAKIEAYEPNPVVLPLLEKNIFENFLDERVTIHPQAVTLVGGSAVLYHESMSSDWQMNANLLGATWVGQPLPSQTVIESVSLAEVIGEGADIVKIDVEGAEHELLQCHSMIFGAVKHLLVEYHPQGIKKLSEMIERIEELGFKVEVSKDGKSIRHLKAHKGLALIHGFKK